MPRFSIASDEDQARLASAAPKTGADLAPYKTALEKLAAPEAAGEPGYSKWARVELADTETRKGERRRFYRVAQELKLTLEYAKEDAETPNVLWMRIRPAPVAKTASETPAEGTPAVVEQAEAVAAGATRGRKAAV